jgi:hypothetical protein
VFGDLHLVTRTRIVEAWLEDKAQMHFTAYAANGADNAVSARRNCRFVDWHEVRHFGNTCLGHEASDEYRRVWKVQLLDDRVVVFGNDLERAAPGVIEQAGENARRVEAGAAEPIDGAVAAD